MGDNSECIDGAVLIVCERQINMEKKLRNVSWHGYSMSKNRMYNAGENVKCCRGN
jgi:hypothetical protein